MSEQEVNQTVPVVTLDGPSGVGKGVMSRMLAAKLGWHLLDSGALYRVLALAAAQKGVAFDDVNLLAELGRELDVRFTGTGLEEGDVILNGNTVTQLIRTEECGNNASKVAAISAVRSALLARQQAFQMPPGLVADGRDMGTIVFPNAALKLFLDASVDIRAERRYKQLIEKGLDVNLPAVRAELSQRDERDRNRPIAPLVPAADAVILDTSHDDINTVFGKIVGLVESNVASQQYTV